LAIRSFRIVKFFRKLPISFTNTEVKTCHQVLNKLIFQKKLNNRKTATFHKKDNNYNYIIRE